MATKNIPDQMHTAPCGMSCVLCMAYQRTKKKCPGCRSEDAGRPYHCTVCSIKNCPKLPSSGFCGDDCGHFPCRRLRQLDKRYRDKYGCSLIGNLDKVAVSGIIVHSGEEKKKWTCAECGSLLCIHSRLCFGCSMHNPFFPKE